MKDDDVPTAQGVPGIQSLRQQYHFDFGPLFQNLYRRCKKASRSHDLTPVAVNEALRKIRLSQSARVSGCRAFDCQLLAKFEETSP